MQPCHCSSNNFSKYRGIQYADLFGVLKPRFFFEIMEMLSSNVRNPTSPALIFRYDFPIYRGLQYE
jgi:hypothetical protein